MLSWNLRSRLICLRTASVRMLPLPESSNFRIENQSQPAEWKPRDRRIQRKHRPTALKQPNKTRSCQSFGQRRARELREEHRAFMSRRIPSQANTSPLWNPIYSIAYLPYSENQCWGAASHSSKPATSASLWQNSRTSTESSAKIYKANLSKSLSLFSPM